MTGKNVKVIQPALVYVIAANAMDDSAPEASTSTAEQQPDEGADGPLSGREKRQARRDRKRTEKAQPAEQGRIKRLRYCGGVNGTNG